MYVCMYERVSVRESECIRVNIINSYGWIYVYIHEYSMYVVYVNISSILSKNKYIK